MSASTAVSEGKREAGLVRLATAAALGTAILLAVAKLGALAITGSIAMMASFIDSCLDILATAFNFFAVRQALQPPDREHEPG